MAAGHVSQADRLISAWAIACDLATTPNAFRNEEVTRAAEFVYRALAEVLESAGIDRAKMNLRSVEMQMAGRAPTFAQLVGPSYKLLCPTCE